MLETLRDKALPWLGGKGPGSESALFTQGTLRRNLADLPFPGLASESERRVVADRVVQAVEQSGLFAGGQYYSLETIDTREARFLEERRLISRELLYGYGPRGVFVSDDQGVSLMINERDHVVVTCHLPGQQCMEVWNRVDQIDTLLSGPLDFAYEDRHGFLASRLEDLGTGLSIRVVMHLPGLGAAQRLLAIDQRFREEHHCIEGLFGRLEDAPGDLFTVGNLATMGRSEEEVVYHVRTRATDLAAQERESRDLMLNEGAHGVADRVGRALGVARGAHLLTFEEGLSLISSLRLGTLTSYLEGFTLGQIGDVMMTSQAAHLELRLGRACDDLTLRLERAGLFRERFS